jgi:hypothetical protein
MYINRRHCSKSVNSDVDLKKSIMNKKINIDIGGMQ